MQIRASFNQAVSIADGASRAEALAAFTHSEFFVSRIRAFEELEKGGQHSVSVLLGILHDETRLNLHDSAIRSLIAIGGSRVGPALTEIVRREMLFWKATAPKLKQGWWNAMDEPNTNVLQSRYSKALEALYGLRKLRFIGSREVVVEFRDLWLSFPQLGDSSGSNQMSEECNEVLKSL
jgi:hypothetical protein